MDNIIINLDDGIRLGDDTLPRVSDQTDIISTSDTIVGPAGPQGPAGPAGKDGEAATITVGSTTTGAAGTNAVVQNSGTSSAAVLDFTIPRGATGATGPQGERGLQGEAGADGQAATITVGSVQTVDPEYPATVINSGTTSAAVLDFTIPRGNTGETGPAGQDGQDGADGQAATITVGSTTTGAAGTNASVTNSGTSSAAVLEFTIPRGETGATGATGSTGPAGPAGADGQAATITVGTTTTGAEGTNASVTNSGTTSAAVLDFVIPRGATGATGSTGPAGADGADGQAATITVGSTTTGAAGTNASVTNSGTSSAAVLEFTIPKGDTGATGPQGPAGVGFIDYSTSEQDTGLKWIDGSTIYRKVFTGTVNISANTLATVSTGTAAKTIINAYGYYDSWHSGSNYNRVAFGQYNGNNIYSSALIRNASAIELQFISSINVSSQYGVVVEYIK